MNAFEAQTNPKNVTDSTKLSVPASTNRPNGTVASFGTTGPVLVIGAGLIGGSLALALRRGGVEVYLLDTSPTALSLGVSLGAGEAYANGATPRELPSPNIVIVATPPDVTAKVVLAALKDFPNSYVYDVASVKKPIVDEVLAANPEAAKRYCSVHPMAGKEVNGIAAASADLFIGRPWIIVAHEGSDPAAVLQARTLGTDVGAFLVALSAKEHDQAVALVSHVPQLVSSLMGGLLDNAPLAFLELAGGGLRDVTRIAASDPRLWNAILAGNATAVREVLLRLESDLHALLQGLEPSSGVPQSWGSSSVGAVNTVMTRGNEGVRRIPGKHGDAASKYGVVGILVPDEPGFLGRLFQDIGSWGINVEDFRLEHSLGQERGLAYVYVVPSAVETLTKHLEDAGWSVANV